MVVYKLSKPIEYVLSGAHGPTRRGTIHEITLQPVAARDLSLLEQHKGMPASLALHGTAALSGLTVAQVKKIDIDDYAPIAIEVLQRLLAASARIGIRQDYFMPPDALP